MLFMILKMPLFMIRNNTRNHFLSEVVIICWDCADIVPSLRRVTCDVCDRKELFFTDAAPDHSLGVSSKHRAPHPSHPSHSAAESFDGSMVRWSDFQCQLPSATTPWWFGFQSEKYSRRSSQRSWRYTQSWCLEIWSYFVLITSFYVEPSFSHIVLVTN